MRRARVGSLGPLAWHLVAVAMVVLVFPADVRADEWDRPVGSSSNCERPGVSPPRCRSVANNLFHFVYFDPSLPPELAASLRDTMREDYGASEFMMFEQRAITPATDVIAYAGDYGSNGAAGWVNCPPDAPQGTNSEGDRWCQRQELYFNLNPRYAVFFADDASRDHITCHELGHTVGLRHWGNPPESRQPEGPTCMHANTPNGPTDLHEIDRDHLDAYPFQIPEPEPQPRWQPI